MVKQSLRTLVSRFNSAREGVAAVEFAIGAPVVLGFLLLMSDVGLAIHARMNLDQAVRSGAEFAMNEVSDVSDLEKLVEGAANGYYSDRNPGDVIPTTDVNAEDSYQVCECPDAPGTAVACGTTICSNGLPASVYYQLVAKQTYDGFFLNIPMSTEIRVQVR